VDEALPFYAVAETSFGEQVDGILLEQSGANSFLHVVTAAGFQHHRFDSLQMQKMGQHQSRGTCSDDSDLGAHSDGGRSL